MKEFTFAIITFNQERLVLDQLESIKYQVRKFGQDYKIDLLVCDDSSRDRTVESVTRWTEANKYLFSSIKIYHHKKNLGTVANYMFALKKVKTSTFKLLAGDDLYSFRNIFEIGGKQNVLLTPTLKFDGENILHKDIWYFYKELLCTPEHKWKKLIKNRIKFQMPIETPGVFWSSELITDELFQELSKYHWIEDIPVWNYLINQEVTRLYFSTQPLILYRVDSGISLNKKHIKKTEFDDELINITKNIMVSRKGLPKGLNVLTYIYWLRRKVLFSLNKARLDAFVSKISEEEQLAKAYTDKIIESANQFYEKVYN